MCLFFSSPPETCSGENVNAGEKKNSVSQKSVIKIFPGSDDDDEDANGQRTDLSSIKIFHS